MKDYKKLQERINREKQITIGDITELGYSRYDINQFIEAGILSRAKRGLYNYLKDIELAEKPPVVEATNDKPIIAEDAFSYVREGMSKVIKRENSEAIESFNKSLEIDPSNSYARIGIIGAYVFLEEFDKAHDAIKNLYRTRENNSLIQNMYCYLLLLKEHIAIDEELLKEIKEEIETKKETLKKSKANYRRLYAAIETQDYLEALKYINFSISLDRKDKKYHITNHIYKSLIWSILRLKNIDPFANQNKEQSLEDNVVDTTVEEKEETIIIVPEQETDTIKINLLLEAINNSDYEQALSLLEQEQIDNPVEVIKTLLTKLSAIKSLITSTEPIKVVNVEPVRVVEEKTLLESTTPEVEEPVLDAPMVEETLPQEQTPIVEEKTKADLAQIAYKAFKDAYHSEQFEEAEKNLKRYEYLNNANGTVRNINYHYIRIERSKKDFAQNPERYIQKKALSAVIFNLKREKRFDAALAAIEEYKSLGGVKNELVILVEAEIYFALGDIAKTSVVLNGIRTSEEPTFFILSSKVAFRNYRFQEALEHCKAFNERRPNLSPANYQLLGDCYTKLGKPGKAVKAYRKAEEISAAYGKKPYDLSDKINRQEFYSEVQKEQRSAKYLGKKK